MLEISDAAHVSGRVPGVCSLIGILLQLTEVGRQQLLVIALDGEVNAVGDESGCIAEEVNIFVDLLDYLERKFADQGAVCNQEDWDLFVPMPDSTKDLKRSAFVELALAF